MRVACSGIYVRSDLTPGRGRPVVGLKIALLARVGAHMRDVAMGAPQPAVPTRRAVGCSICERSCSSPQACCSWPRFWSSRSCSPNTFHRHPTGARARPESVAGGNRGQHVDWCLEGRLLGCRGATDPVLAVRGASRSGRAGALAIPLGSAQNCPSSSWLSGRRSTNCRQQWFCISCFSRAISERPLASSSFVWRCGGNRAGQRIEHIAARELAFAA